MQAASDPIEVFTTATERHLMQALFQYVTACLAGEEKYSVAALSVMNEIGFGHADLTGNVYMSNASFTNETTPTTTSAEFDLLLTTHKRAWTYFCLPASMSESAARADGRSRSYWEFLGLPDTASVEEATTASHKALVDNSDVLRRAVDARPGATVEWRSKEHAKAISHCLVNDGHPQWKKRAPFHVGVFTETGAGKSLTFIVPALLQQLNVREIGANVTFVIGPRCDLSVDTESRAAKCGVRVKLWTMESMASCMQKTRVGDGAYLFVSVIDTFVSPASLVLIAVFLAG